MILVDGVKTYSNREALSTLAQLAAQIPETEAIVEVGVYRGGSVKTLAQNTDAHVYGVDTWGLEQAYASGSENPGKYGLDNMRIAERLLAGLSNLTLIRDYSVQAAATYDGPPIGLLYIDAEHTRQAVLADWYAWSPHLTPTAVIAFDDYDTKHPDLQAGINHIITETGLTLEVHGNRLAVTRKAHR